MNNMNEDYENDPFVINNLEDALQYVENASVEELLNIEPYQIDHVRDTVGLAGFETFLFAKNVKIFGGIDAYVLDFIARGPINHLIAMPQGPNKVAMKRTVLKVLNRMRTYPGISAENVQRINLQIGRINGAAAPAAGGYRKRHRKTRKNKNSRKARK